MGAGLFPEIRAGSLAPPRGDFYDDLKHGSGTLIWDDGRRYRGDRCRARRPGCHAVWVCVGT
eukprot:8132130-Alexandrium_andersonii.AAC.1